MQGTSSCSSGSRHEYREAMLQRLAAATRHIGWTYSILWQFCPVQQGLVWGEGYLHGPESTELSLRRSQQLFGLYNAMADTGGVGMQQPTSSENIDTPMEFLIVAPQNLTPMEWFFVGSMDVFFATGDGLPGRALARRRHVWHCSTGEAVTEGPARAHLAQRARLQTIVCVPVLEGVLEFGTTALVEENTNIVKEMTSTFMEQPKHPAWEYPAALLGIGQARLGAFKKWEPAAAAPHGHEVLHRQRMLKTALLTIPRLHTVTSEVHGDEYAARATSAHNFGDASGKRTHLLAERRRRVELNDRFVTLRRLVPLGKKPTKVSLLGDAIDYVADLQRQVRQLEATAKKSNENPMKLIVEVTVKKKTAVVKISCAWHDDLLIEILQQMEDLQLEVVDAHAEVFEDTLYVTLNAQVPSSDRSSEENKTAEIQAALLNMIEKHLRGKAVNQ